MADSRRASPPGSPSELSHAHTYASQSAASSARTSGKPASALNGAVDCPGDSVTAPLTAPSPPSATGPPSDGKGTMRSLLHQRLRYGGAGRTRFDSADHFADLPDPASPASSTASGSPSGALPRRISQVRSGMPASPTPRSPLARPQQPPAHQPVGEIESGASQARHGGAVTGHNPLLPHQLQ